MYIFKFSNNVTKQNADNMVDNIFDEYITTIKESSWVEETTKEKAVNRTNAIAKYVGYHDNLEMPEVENFYDNLPDVSHYKFLEMALAFTVFSADREYRRTVVKKGEVIMPDWSK